MEMSPYLLDRVNRDEHHERPHSLFTERGFAPQLGPDRLDQRGRGCIHQTGPPKFDERHVPAFLREDEDLQRRIVVGQLEISSRPFND
jgi:hypothetical protein